MRHPRRRLAGDLERTLQIALEVVVVGESQFGFQIDASIPPTGAHRAATRKSCAQNTRSEWLPSLSQFSVNVRSM